MRLNQRGGEDKDKFEFYYKGTKLEYTYPPPQNLDLDKEIQEEIIKAFISDNDIDNAFDAAYKKAYEKALEFARNNNELEKEDVVGEAKQEALLYLYHIFKQPPFKSIDEIQKTLEVLIEIKTLEMNS